MSSSLSPTVQSTATSQDSTNNLTKEEQIRLEREEKLRLKEERKRQYEQQAELNKRNKQQQKTEQKQQNVKQEQKQKSSATLESKNETVEKLKKEIESLKNTISAQNKRLTQNRIYSHLDPYKSLIEKSQIPVNSKVVHPAIVNLGLQYANGLIRGGNARCVAFMEALKQVIMDYEAPADKAFKHDFIPYLEPQIDFLKRCRPMSIGMGNALKHFKTNELAKLDPSKSQTDTKQHLIDVIDKWIKEKIEYTMKSIVEKGIQKIQNGDVVLTYGRSEVVEEIFLAAHKQGKQFSVVVVNSRPKNEGRELLQKLSSAGVKCSFCLINSVPYMLKEVKSVMLGAQGMLSNGSVLSRIGTAMICLAARSYNKPILICCETYKFSEHSRLDSITRNEISDPDELAIPAREGLRQNLIKLGLEIEKSKEQYRESILNLTYDVTPGEWVDVLITEVGLLPCTSVPVIIREIYAQNNANQ
jgi:translation initiation factor eIF-2B subunit delta